MPWHHVFLNSIFPLGFGSFPGLWLSWYKRSNCIYFIFSNPNFSLHVWMSFGFKWGPPKMHSLAGNVTVANLNEVTTREDSSRCNPEGCLVSLGRWERNLSCDPHMYQGTVWNMSPSPECIACKSLPAAMAVSHQISHSCCYCSTDASDAGIKYIFRFKIQIIGMVFPWKKYILQVQCWFQCTWIKVTYLLNNMH